MKKTKLYLAIAAICSGINLQAQLPPTVDWSLNLGGSSADVANWVTVTSDGGYIICGNTESSDGDVIINNGERDVWIVKMDISGNIEWKNTYGGSSAEDAKHIVQTTDGGYLFAGYTQSTDGDVAGNHGGQDGWIVKLNASGEIEWQRCYGGSGYEEISKILLMDENTFMFCGTTYSNDGDLAETTLFGVGDIWVLHAETDGDIRWTKVYGGTSFESASNIIRASDGGAIVVGSTLSNDFFAEGSKGGYDGIIFKLKPSNGFVLWKTMIGKGKDEYINSIVEDPSGGYIFSGHTNSSFPDYHGYVDVMVGKIKSNGTPKWIKTYGGTHPDFAYEIIRNNTGGYIVCGSTSSKNGDVSNKIGANDGWVIGLNSIGQLEWEKTYGGTLSDFLYSVAITPDNGVIVCGASYSSDFDLLDNKGATDYWILKLGPATEADFRVLTADDEKSLVKLYPNPVEQYLNISISGDPLIDIVNITLYDMQGSWITSVSLSPNAENNFRMLMPSGVIAGTYIIHVQSGDIQWDGSIVVKN